MPEVDGKKYPYTDKGKSAAKAALLEGVESATMTKGAAISAGKNMKKRKAKVGQQHDAEFAKKFPKTAKDIARKSAGLAPEDQAKVTRKEGPMDTGGLDPRDKTSFKKEFEPAWVGRERKRDRAHLPLSQVSAQAPGKGPAPDPRARSTAKAKKRKKEARDFAAPGEDSAAEYLKNRGR